MSLTDFPALVDSFPSVDAGAGDKLNTPAKLHDALHNKIADAVAELERISVGPTHINVKAFGPIGAGFDDTTVLAAVAAASPGNTLVFPPAVYLLDPGDLAPTKALRYQGGGRFSSILRAKSNAAFPMLTVNPVSGSAPFNYYGPVVTDLGIDNSAAALATGLRLGVNTGWAEVNGLFVQGGAVSVNNLGFNNWIENFLVADATKFFVIDGDTGLELVLCNGAMARNSVGTTTIGIEVICVSTGTKGALMMSNVRGSSGVSGGVQTNSWLKMQAPSALSVPLFADGCIFDNCIGGGPGMEFVNVYDINFARWANCGASSGGPTVRINGGGRLSFDGTFFGGGSPAKTFDLLGTIDVLEIAGTTPTGTVVYFNPGAVVTNLFFHAKVPGSAVMANITNDNAAFLLATAKKWGPERFANIAQLDHILNAGAPTCQVGTLPGGTPNQVVIPVPEGLDAFYSQFIPFRFSPAGTLGRLEVAGKNATTDEVTIESASATDTSIVGFFRFDIPH